MTLVIVNGVLLTYLALRPAPPDPLAGRSALPAAQTADAPAPAEPTVQETAAEEEPTTPPVLAVYGDGYSAGSALGGQGETGWPALVARQLGADLRLNAVARAGYAAVGANGQDFAGLVSATPVPDATVTVVFGSRNDLGSPVSAVAGNATETLQLIRRSAPNTELVVVGPAWSTADAPADLLPLRNAVADAARAADATFVDPLAEGWFAQPGVLIAPDEVSPTDAGHEFLASRIAPVVQEALSAAGNPTEN
ncbi:SGNH/GDSL hydrolase family protein [Geodermatophilus sp. SYSU D00965]